MCYQKSLLLSKGAVHTRMVEVLPGSVGQTKGTGLTSVYYVDIRTRPRWPFWPPPQGLPTNAALLVRI